MIRGRPKISLLPLFLLLLLSLPVFGRSLEWATVVKIIDGDTLVVKYQGKDRESDLLMAVERRNCLRLIMRVKPGLKKAKGQAVG